MFALRATGVAKRFGPTRALDDVSLEVAPGSIHALLGGNGSGKSTLIKVLSGVEVADAGRLQLPDGAEYDLRSMTPKQAWMAGLRFVHQDPTVFPEASVAENLCLGARFVTGRGGRVRWGAVRRRAAQLIDAFQIDAHPDQPLGELSPARQTMVTIARALQDQERADHGVLVLDEPTESLPRGEVGLLLDAVRGYADAGRAIVYVTHRLEEVFAIADRATLLRDGRNVDTVSPKALTHDMLVELILGRAVVRVERGVENRRGGPARLRVSGLAAGAVRSLDLTAAQGEIVGVAGLIGSGRSSLFQALFGAIEVEQGEVVLDGVRVAPTGPREAMAAGFAYVPESRADFAFPDLTVKENMSISNLSRYWRRGALDLGAERRAADTDLDAFLIKAESSDMPLRSLSGGNQQKTLLARCLRRSPRVLLLDEPTQGVDVGARAEILQLIQRAARDGATALIASSDFEELATVCDRAIVLRNGRKVTELSGAELTADRLNEQVHAMEVAT